MGALQDFLNANTIDNITEEVIISDRFKDKDGKILKFKIKAMTDKEFENARRASTKIGKKGKTEVDNMKLNYSILMNNVIEPNFNDSESIKALGCITPEQYISKVLLAGEIQAIVKSVMELSGFSADMNEMIEEVKN